MDPHSLISAPPRFNQDLLSSIHTRCAHDEVEAAMVSLSRHLSRIDHSSGFNSTRGRIGKDKRNKKKRKDSMKMKKKEKKRRKQKLKGVEFTKGKKNAIQAAARHTQQNYYQYIFTPQRTNFSDPGSTKRGLPFMRDESLCARNDAAVDLQMAQGRRFAGRSSIATDADTDACMLEVEPVKQLHGHWPPARPTVV